MKRRKYGTKAQAFGYDENETDAERDARRKRQEEELRRIAAGVDPAALGRALSDLKKGWSR